MADRTYAVTFEVPHSARGWRWVAASFDDHLAAQVAVIPRVCSAELVAEVRRGRDGLRLRIAVTVRAADLGQAVSIAWEVLDAGLTIAKELSSAAPGTMDVVITGDGLIPTDVEVQHSPEQARLIKRRTLRFHAAGYLPVWFSDRRDRPSYLATVPGLSCDDQRWREYTPARGTVWAIGLGHIRRELRCEVGAFGRYRGRCPASRRDPCGQVHPEITADKRALIDDVAAMIPAGELVPLRDFDGTCSWSPPPTSPGTRRSPKASAAGQVPPRPHQSRSHAAPLTPTAAMHSTTCPGPPAAWTWPTPPTWHGYKAVPHLSARLVRDRSHLEEIVARLTQDGISDVFIPAGDANPPADQFDSAVALLEEFNEMGRPFAEAGVDRRRRVLQVSLPGTPPGSHTSACPAPTTQTG